MIPILGDIIKEVGGIVSEVIPDADKKMDIELKFAELADKADQRENDLLMGQIDVNKEEAKSANLFVAGWRPFIGWGGGAACIYTWIIAPMFNLNALDADKIYPIILAMLGIGTMRTVEKMNGVATSLNGKVLTPVKPIPTQIVQEHNANLTQPTKEQKGWFK
jgi:hypothetical protein